MIFLNPMEMDKDFTLHAGYIGTAIKAIGTDGYDSASLEVFTHAFDADPLDLLSSFRGPRNADPRRPAAIAFPGDASIQRFISDCHRLDPALTTASKSSRTDARQQDGHQRHSGSALSQVLRAYRRHERLSLYSRCAADLYQLSIYRKPRQPGRHYPHRDRHLRRLPD